MMLPIVSHYLNSAFNIGMNHDAAFSFILVAKWDVSCWVDISILPPESVSCDTFLWVTETKDHSGRHLLGFLDQHHAQSKSARVLYQLVLSWYSHANRKTWLTMNSLRLISLHFHQRECYAATSVTAPGLVCREKWNLRECLAEEQEIGGWMVFHYRGRLNRKIPVTEITLNMLYVPDLPCWPAYDCTTEVGHLTLHIHCEQSVSPWFNPSLK